MVKVSGSKAKGKSKKAKVFQAPSR